MKIIMTVGIIFVVLLLVWIVGQWWYITYKIEQPKYTVVEKKSVYEIRQYESYIVASADVPDDGRALNSGFRLVADYIFGNNTSVKSDEALGTVPVLERNDVSESVAMTSPVIDEKNDDGTRTVAFILPSQYTLDTLPTPNNDQVRIEEVVAQKWAVLRYSGNSNDKQKEEKYIELTDALDSDSVEYTVEWQSAGYNPPFTLPILKRNEVWVKLK